MSRALVVLLLLGAGTFVLKSAGPLVLGARPLPPRVDIAARRLPAALLAALVVVSVASEGARVAIDARIVGIAAAALALRLRAPFVVVVVVAVAATAAVRALT